MTIIDKILSDGTFVLSGRPEVLFPKLALQDYQLHLTICVASAQFLKGYAEYSLTVTVPKGWTFDQPISKELPTSTSTILVLLPADPVFIRGYVFDIDNPGVGIANATVTIQQGSNTFTTLTSATVGYEGKYSFQDSSDPTKLQAFTITANNPATISCFAPHFESALLDFWWKWYIKIQNDQSPNPKTLDLWLISLLDHLKSRRDLNSHLNRPLAIDFGQFLHEEYFYLLRS